jgi:polysaccharide chain length determinant protein (PEP-CTERM system associated)
MNALIEEARIALHVVWRRRWLALGVAWAVALVGWLAVSLIPNSYRSTAKVYVQPQSILPAAVGITANDQQAAVDGVRQTLLSANNLTEVIGQTDLAKRAQTPREVASLVSRLQTAIEIKSTQDNFFEISATLSGGGFTDAQNAHLSQDVVQKLVDRFVAGSSAGDAAEAQRSLAFMDKQLATRGAALQDADAKRSAFEQRYLAALPGTGAIEDRIALARTQISDIDSQLASASSSAAAIGGELAATPATIPGAAVAGTVSGARAQVAALQGQLADDRARGWTDQHPDVVALKGQIARLSGAASAEPVGGGPGASQPNPAYASLAAMAAEKRANAAALSARRGQLQADIDRFANIQQTQPEVASQQAELSRNYDVLKSGYDKLLGDREAVKLRADAQATTGSVAVRVIQPPALPRVPAKPMRPLLLTGVLLLALGAGAGTAWARAKLTTSYSTPAALSAASGLPVLGAIGFVAGARQQAVRAKQLKWFAGTGGALVGSWLLLLVVEFVQRGLMA